MRFSTDSMEKKGEREKIVKLAFGKDSSSVLLARKKKIIMIIINRKGGGVSVIQHLFN